VKSVVNAPPPALIITTGYDCCSNEIPGSDELWARTIEESLVRNLINTPRERSSAMRQGAGR
jgi:hypothetical protein